VLALLCGVASCKRSGPEPDVVATLDAPALATFLPSGMAADDTAFYATGWEWEHEEEGQLVAVPRDGGSPTILASGLLAARTPVVHEDRVYWLTGTRVMSVPTGGGDLSVVATGDHSFESLAIDGDMLYVGTGGAILRVPTSGGTPQQVASWDGLAGPGSLAVHDSRIFFPIDTLGRVATVPAAGGDMTVLATGAKFTKAIVVAADRIVWRAMTAEHPEGQILSLPVAAAAGTAPEVLYTFTKESTGTVASYRDRLYYDEGNVIYALPIDGSDPTRLGAVEEGPRGLWVDDTGVYWLQGWLGRVQLRRAPLPQQRGSGDQAAD
jgi:hypothetical protein